MSSFFPDRHTEEMINTMTSTSLVDKQESYDFDVMDEE